MAGEAHAYRVRVGDYRVVYEVMTAWSSRWFGSVIAERCTAGSEVPS